MAIAAGSHTAPLTAMIFCRVVEVEHARSGIGALVEIVQVRLNQEVGDLVSQDSQGQARQDSAQQRASQNWSGPIELVSSTDASPRVGSATAAPSRIDYRV